MRKLNFFGNRIRLSQLLTIFLIGVVFAVSNAYGPTLLQARTINNSQVDTPMFSFYEGGVNAADKNDTLVDRPTSIKTAQGTSNPSFKNVIWSTVAPSPIARSEAQSVVLDGKLYVFGGYINTTYTPTRRADVYNPINNTWTRITDLPIGLTHSGTAVDGKNIYLAGGYPAKPTGGQSFTTQDVWKYNVETNTWSSMPPLPQARGSGV